MSSVGSHEVSVGESVAGRRFVLSVVVPTRNRAEYALGAIEQILSIPDADLQLVVQDNGDDDTLALLAASYMEDVRFTYNYTPGTLSFVDNFSEGVSRAEGEFVCVIGDDDGVNPEILEVARWALSHGVRAVKPGLQLMYLWPGAGIPGEADDGQLIVHRISGATRVAHTEGQLVELLRNGCQEYLDRDLAKLYHGFVRREALDAVKAATGHYFGGLSPDIYAAVSLSTVIDQVVCIDYPLTISGICRKSGSADSATGRHTGELRDAPHFTGHASYEWAEEVPQFYSVATIWADSSLAALREMNRADLRQEFNSAALAAHCLLQHPEFGELVMEHYRSVAQRSGVRWLSALRLLASRKLAIRLRGFARRVRGKLTGSGKVVERCNDVPDIAAASIELTRLLRQLNLAAHKCLVELEARLAEEPPR